MTQRAQVKVTLDTRQAEQRLRELSREGGVTAKRINAGGGATGSTPGVGLGGSFSAGAAAGVGFGLARRATNALAGDAIGGFIDEGVGFGAAVFGDLTGLDEVDAQNRARRAAREETISNFAYQVGTSGDMSGAKAFYNQILEAKHLPQAQGAARLNKELRGARAASDAIETGAAAVQAEVGAKLDSFLGDLRDMLGIGK